MRPRRVRDLQHALLAREALVASSLRVPRGEEDVGIPLVLSL